MPEINLAVLMRWAIIFLQYSFLLCIYCFIYRIGRLIYQDLTRLPAISTQEQIIEEKQVSTLEAYLSVVEADEPSGLLPGIRIPLQQTVMIGRSAKHNMIVIHEAFVSSEHALIQSYDNQYWISDLNSTNGTIVNGRRIEDETPLKIGDQIKIGSVILRFER